MKKLRLLLLPFCVLFVLSACKKNSTSPTSGTGTITASIDGTTQTFNVGATAHLESASGMDVLSIEGIQSNTVVNSIIIAINNSAPIVAGTYTGSASQADFSYTQANPALVYQYDGSNNASNASVTIKSISSTNVQGTFSGTLVLISGSGAATKTVTNGTFNLSIK